MSDGERVDAAELLKQMSWVRSLARELVADETAADDVAQEVWLRALRSPPRDINLVAWLRTVVRNVTRSRHRADESRRQREQAIHRERVAPDPAEVFDRAKVTEQLTAQVVALPETYREVIVLRFYDELPPREIAKRLGVPVETVRTRLKRAIDRLRTSLDSRYEGDRGRWMRAMAPLATVPAIARWKLTALGGTLAATAVVGGVMLATRTPAGPDPAAVADRGEVTAPDRRVAARPASPRPARGTPPAEASVTATTPTPATPVRFADAEAVTGVVRNAAGHPIADAIVRAIERPVDPHWRLGKSIRLHPVVIARARTDREGRFRIGPITERVLLCSRASGHARDRRLVAPRSRQEIVLPEPSRLYGRISHEDGRSPEGLVVVVGLTRGLEDLQTVIVNGCPNARRVQYGTAMTTCDAEGAWSIDDLPQGDYFVGLSPRDAGAFYCPPVTVDKPAVEFNYVCAKRPTRCITGRVRDENGEPVVGAEVWPAPNPAYRVRTDAAGYFTLDRCSFDMRFLRCAHPDFLELRRGVIASMNRSVVYLTMKKAQPPAGRGTVVGRVTDPILPMRVSLYGVRRGPAQQIDRDVTPVPVDSTGAFRLENVPAGNYFAVVIHGREVRMRGETVRVRAEQTSALDLGASPRGTISGHVVDADGRPLPAAKITITRQPRGHALHTTYSALDGSFRLTGLAAATYRLVAEAGILRAEAFSLRPGAKGVVLQPARRRLIAGQITSTDGNVPRVIAISWSHASGGEPSSSEVHLSEDGRYQMIPPMPGVYNVFAWTDDAVSPIVSRLRVGPDGLDGSLDFNLQPSCAIRGIATGPDGNPIRAALVRYASTDGPPTGLCHGAWTNDEGAFSLRGLQPGTGALIASDGEHAIGPLSISLSRGETKDLPLRMGRGARLRVRMLDAAGHGVSHLTVSLLPLDTAPFGHGEGRPEGVLTGSDGEAAFAGVLAGRYQIWARSLAGYAKAMEITLRPGDDRTVDVRALPANTICLDVIDRNARPVAGATVRVFDAEDRDVTRDVRFLEQSYLNQRLLDLTLTRARHLGSRHTSVVADGGRYYIPWIAKGPYRIVVSHPTLGEASSTIQLDGVMKHTIRLAGR